MSTAERRAVVIGGGIIGTACAHFLAWDGWRVTQQARRDTPTFVKLAREVERRLPNDAVLLVEERQKLERVMVMFFTGRTAYGVTPDTWRQTADQVIAAGGRPYVVSHRPMPLAIVAAVPEEGRTVYDPGQPVEPARP